MVWVAVVGPSGVGKDTLLAGARAALRDDARFHFARRAISRAADAGGEEHEFLPAAAFDAADLSLRWEAHGLRYGIRREELAQAPVTLLNLSRTVLAQAAALHPLLVVAVTAPPAVLAQRLARRGREGEAEILARLRREAPLPPGLRVVRICNDHSPEAGIATLVSSLRTCAEGGFRP